MYRNLLVPLDGSQRAAAVLPVAAALATATNGQVRLVGVVPGHEPGRRKILDLEEDLGRDGFELAQRGLLAGSDVLVGDPAETLVRLVELHGYDLVVMATHGRHGLARIVRGSVAGTVLRRSPVPLVLFRPDGAPISGQLSTLLVPLDGTPGSAVALTAATALAKAAGARLVLVHVVAPVPAWVYSAEDTAATTLSDATWDGMVVRGANTFLGEVRDRLREEQVAVETIVRLGDVSRRLRAAADEVQADLIVMSTHALVGPKRTLLGSVADALVRESGRPVLLLRRQQDGAR
jgi:nucleotide-binding universal stress UspA family protein